MPSRIVKNLAAAALLFATTASAEELCVNYVGGLVIHSMDSELSGRAQQCEGGKCAFTSFNPRTKESVVVATIAAPPQYVTWEKGFGALMYTLDYKEKYRLEWKVGASPTLLPHDSRIDVYPNKSSSQTLGKQWKSTWSHTNALSPSFDAPAHRKIEAWDASGDTYSAFGTPVTWTNTETGEMKFLTWRPIPDLRNGTSHPLEISTADNFILIAEMFGGSDAFLADMNTGEMLLRAGDHSEAAAWGKCPAK